MDAKEAYSDADFVIMAATINGCPKFLVAISWGMMTELFMGYELMAA